MADDVEIKTRNLNGPFYVEYRPDEAEFSWWVFDKHGFPKHCGVFKFFAVRKCRYLNKIWRMGQKELK